MKNPIFYYLIPVLFIILLGACTQEKMNIETVEDAEVTLRSTQAECDSIQSNFPQVTDDNYCIEFAKLFECRLNQGVDEADVIANCTLIDQYTFPTVNCVTASDLFFGYQTIVNQYKSQVYQNTNPCSAAICPPPQNQQACRIIIFSVSFTGSSCIENGCRLTVQADVYCCP